jgi:hypothetical protein
MTATAAERAALVGRWERASEWPLMIAALVFLAAYAVPILDPNLPGWLLDLCRSLSWITWGIFVVDILVRLFLADERLRVPCSSPSASSWWTLAGTKQQDRCSLKYTPHRGKEALTKWSRYRSRSKECSA